MAIISGYQPVQQIINPQGLFTLPINEMYKAIENRERLYDAAETANTGALAELYKIKSAVLPQSRGLIDEQIENYIADTETIQEKYGNDLSNPLYNKNLKNRIAKEAGNPIYSDAMYSAKQKALYDEMVPAFVAQHGAIEPWQDRFQEQYQNWDGTGRLDTPVIESPMDFSSELITAAQEVIPREFGELVYDEDKGVYIDSNGKVRTIEEIESFLSGLNLDKTTAAGQQYTRRFGEKGVQDLYRTVAEGLDINNLTENFKAKDAQNTGNTNRNPAKRDLSLNPNATSAIGAPVYVHQARAGYEPYSVNDVVKSSNDAVNEAYATFRETPQGEQFVKNVYPESDFNIVKDNNTQTYSIELTDKEGNIIDWKNDPKLGTAVPYIFEFQERVTQAKQSAQLAVKTEQAAIEHAREVSGNKNWAPDNNAAFKEYMEDIDNKAKELYTEINGESSIPTIKDLLLLADQLMVMIPYAGGNSLLGNDYIKAVKSDTAAVRAYKEFFNGTADQKELNTLRQTTLNAFMFKDESIEDFYPVALDFFTSMITAQRNGSGNNDSKAGLVPFMDLQTGLPISSKELDELSETLSNKDDETKKIFQSMQWFMDAGGYSAHLNVNGKSLVIPPEFAVKFFESYFSYADPDGNSTDRQVYNLLTSFQLSRKVDPNSEEAALYKDAKPFGFIGTDANKAFVKVLTNSEKVNGVTYGEGTYVYTNRRGEESYFVNEYELGKHHLQQKLQYDIEDYINQFNILDRIDYAEGDGVRKESTASKTTYGTMQISQGALTDYNSTFNKTLFFDKDNKITDGKTNKDYTKEVSKGLLTTVYPKVLMNNNVTPHIAWAVMSYNDGPMDVVKYATEYQRTGELKLDTVNEITKRYIVITFTNLTYEKYNALDLKTQKELQIKALESVGIKAV